MSGTNDNLIQPVVFDNDKIKSRFIPNHNELIRPVEFEEPDKGFEEKIYIILYKINTDDNDDVYKNIYSICTGRTMAYSDIKDKLVSGLDIDIHRSLVITETKQTETITGDKKYYMIPYKDLISVYAFCISISDFYDTDEFDIEDYNNGEVPEDFDNTQNANTGTFFTPEQMEYKKLLDQSIHRERFISNMRDELGITDEYNI